MNISISMGNIPQNRLFAGGMLKSTQEKMERKKKCDNMVAFYEERISMLKDMKSDSLEDISRKLELFHTYQDGIAAAKQDYNNQQMFHVLDEAREQGEKIAEAAEDMKPKTAEERREDMIEEALGTEDKGELTESMEEIADMVEEMSEEVLEDVTELAEELPDKIEDVSSVLPTEMDQDALQTKDKTMLYRPIDCYV